MKVFTEEEENARKLRNRVKEAIRRPIATITGRRGVMFDSTPDKTDSPEFKLPRHLLRNGEKPAVDFVLQYYVYTNDPLTGQTLNFIAGQVAGPGFHISVNPKYAKAEEAKKLLEKTSKDLKLDVRARIAAVQCVAWGNSFWWLREGDINNIVILPITAIEKIYRNEWLGFEETKITTSQTIKLGYKLTSLFGGKIIPPEEMIHFKFNPINSEAFGSGFVRALCVKMSVGGEERDAWYKIRGRMLNASDEILEKTAGANELWNFPGLDDDKTRKWGRKIKTLPKKGARFTSNMDQASVTTVVPEVLRGWSQLYDAIMNEYIIGLGSPLPKAFTTPGFTEASINGAIELLEKQVIGPIQRDIKRTVESRIWIPVLESHKYKPAEEVEARLNWGLPEEPEIEFTDIMSAWNMINHSWDIGAISTNEHRKLLGGIIKMLVDNGWTIEELEELKDKDQKARSQVAGAISPRDKRLASFPGKPGPNAHNKEHHS